MSKTWTLWQKIKAITSLVVVFLLVLATNLMDKNHFEVVESALSSVYEDRLMAKDYLFRMSRQLQQKRNMLQHDDLVHAQNTILAADDSLEVLMTRFEGTKMTSDEAGYAEKLRESFGELKRNEQKLFESKEEGVVLLTQQKLIKKHEEMILTIDKLFAIQMKEGKRQIDYSNSVIDRSNLIAKMEIGALIVIGLIIQFLIFFRPSRDDD